jgi:hypothetical protein
VLLFATSSVLFSAALAVAASEAKFVLKLCFLRMVALELPELNHFIKNNSAALAAFGF